MTTRKTQSAERKASVTAYKMRLYIAGNAPNSRRARANLAAVMQQYGPETCELEIIDVEKSPERAMKDAVLVTPTLVKLSPKPACHIIGDLSDQDKVIDALGL